MNDDVLQIAMKYNNTVFNKYINPTKCINSKASTVHGLTKENNDLYLRGVKDVSSPVRIALNELLTFLQNIGKPCVLVAHNCNFNATRLCLKIKEVYLTEEFHKVTVSFTDSLFLFRKRFPARKAKGAYKLEILTEELISLCTKGAHDAIYDVILIEKLIYKFYNELVERAKSIDLVIKSINKQKN